MTNPPSGIDALIQKYCVMWRPRDARPGEVVPEQAPSFVQRFRRDLWAHYCGIPLVSSDRVAAEHEQYTALLPFERALSIWNYRWGKLILGLSLSSGRRYTREDMGVDGEGLPAGELFKEIRAIPLPMAEPKTRFHQGEYNRYDTDSTQRF